MELHLPTGSSKSLVIAFQLILITHTDVQQSIYLHQFALICIYAACKEHIYIQINMANIYIGPIYMFDRLYICIYALHIHIYSNIYPYTQSTLHIYIYIYICICSTRPRNTTCKPLALQEAAVNMV